MKSTKCRTISHSISLSHSKWTSKPFCRHFTHQPRNVPLSSVSCCACYADCHPLKDLLPAHSFCASKWLSVSTPMRPRAQHQISISFSKSIYSALTVRYYVNAPLNVNKFANWFTLIVNMTSLWESRSFNPWKNIFVKTSLSTGAKLTCFSKRQASTSNGSTCSCTTPWSVFQIRELSYVCTRSTCWPRLPSTTLTLC